MPPEARARLDHLWDEHGARIKRKKGMWEEEGGKMYR
jgi:hypothetical protein